MLSTWLIFMPMAAALVLWFLPWHGRLPGTLAFIAVLTPLILLYFAIGRGHIRSPD